MVRKRGLTMALLSVGDALAQVLDQVGVLDSETVPLRLAHQRVLAEQVVALRTQPPFAASAMDGYAMRADDLAIGLRYERYGRSQRKNGVRLRVENWRGRQRTWGQEWGMILDSVIDGVAWQRH